MSDQPMKPIPPSLDHALRHAHRRRPIRQHQVTILLAACLFGMALGGCDLGAIGNTLGDLFRINDDAAAQGTGGSRQLSTFIIEAGSFQIQTATDPTMTVQGEATEYTLQADSEVRFDEVGGNARNLQLGANDRVIERPGSFYTVTVLSDENEQ